MVHDQADVLRDLARRRAHAAPEIPAQMVSVSGGRGGVGATTVALNLALALVEAGQRVVLVDADLDREGSAALLKMPTRGTILDCIAGRRTVHEVLELGPGGIQILPGAWAATNADDCSAAAQQRLIAELAALGAHADAVVVDLGAARNHFVRRFWHASDLTLVVAEPEPAAIMDAYASIKVLLVGDASPAVQTVVNRAKRGEESSSAHARIAEACRRFLGLRVAPAGELPDDRALSEPLVHGPLKPATERAREQLAARVWDSVMARRQSAASAA